MTTQAPERVVETVAPRRRPWLMLVVAVIVIALVAGLAWWIGTADEGPPTVTFDGETVTYDGPTSFEAGEVIFTFDSSAYEPGVAFTVGELTDDTITMADTEAWAAANPGNVPPEFIGGYSVTFADEGDRIVEKSIDLLPASRYAIWAITAPDDNNQGYPAAIIEVE